MSNLSTPLTLPSLPAPSPAEIVIVGLGPGPVQALTLEAWQTLAHAPRLLARTRRHPCMAEIAAMRAASAPPGTSRDEDCDDLYEAHRDFAQVYDAIAKRVVERGALPGGVVYAVPGHPIVGEATTPLILERAGAAGLRVRLVDGVSFIGPSYAAVGVDPMDGSQIVDAMLLAQQHHPQIDVGLPLLVGQVYSRAVASDLKLTLMNAYPDEHPVTLIHAAGSDQQRRRTLPLHELDYGVAAGAGDVDDDSEDDESSVNDGGENGSAHDPGDFDHLTSLYVPPLPHGSSYSHLQEIVAHLRSPEGCPWDQEQTLESLRSDLLGECVEVLEAIDAETDGETEDNSAQIAEELGDLILVATMLVQIAVEEGRFKMSDVAANIHAKLVRRHPHVFGETSVDDVGQVLTQWDQIKAAEKKAKGQQAGSPFEGIPAALPALEKARVTQSKANKAKLLDRKAIAQSKPALARLFGGKPTAEAIGETLWALVALAHQHDINAEDALRSHIVRVRARLGKSS